MVFVNSLCLVFQDLEGVAVGAGEGAEIMGTEGAMGTGHPAETVVMMEADGVAMMIAQGGVATEGVGVMMMTGAGAAGEMGEAGAETAGTVRARTTQSSEKLHQVNMVLNLPYDVWGTLLSKRLLACPTCSVTIISRPHSA